MMYTSFVLSFIYLKLVFVYLIIIYNHYPFVTAPDLNEAVRRIVAMI